MTAPEPGAVAACRSGFQCWNDGVAVTETRIRLGAFSLRLIRDFLPAERHRQLLARLREDLPWRQDRIRLFGRQVTIPRQQCWVGDAGAHYRYSGLDLKPLPWPDWLEPIRHLVGAACDHEFNSVLCNRYRDGADSMGWHSDNEAELGPAPLIASFTLGADRRFQFRHRHDRASRESFLLPDNSLLIMPPGLQAQWQHQLPKTRRMTGERINLTFRHIFPARQSQ